MLPSDRLCLRPSRWVSAHASDYSFGVDADGLSSGDEDAPAPAAVLPAASPPAASPPAAASAAATAPTVKSEVLQNEEDEDDDKVADALLARTTRQLFERGDESMADLYYKSPLTLRPTKYTITMSRLMNLLNTPYGLILFKNALRVNMRFKVEKYGSLRAELEKRLSKEQSKFDNVSAGIKEDAHIYDDTSNWSIYDERGKVLADIRRQISDFFVVEEKARIELNSNDLDTDGLPASNTAIPERVKLLLAALERLTFFSQQPMILESVSELVVAFILNPYYIQKKFMNFLFAGPAGTGKTTLVREIAKVFSVAGIFVFDTVVEGGRDNFIAPYEGQTVGKTMGFLTAGLDSGVIFVDEAYSITTWDKGLPSSYGAEATAAMVDFMTKYKGLYCLMFAGYEKDMRRYFLTSNEGLPRRIPYQFKLQDYSPEDLVIVYKRTLLTELGLKMDNVNDAAIKYIESAFTGETWVWLLNFVTISRKHSKRVYRKAQFDEKTHQTYENEVVIVPENKYMYDLFKNQAGSMTNLAEATVVMLVNTIDPAMLNLMQGEAMSLDDAEYVASSSDGATKPLPPAPGAGRTKEDLAASRAARFMFSKGNPLPTLKNVIIQRIRATYLSAASVYLDEFTSVSNLADAMKDMYYRRLVAAVRIASQSGLTPPVLEQPNYFDKDAKLVIPEENFTDDAYDLLERPRLPTRTGGRKKNDRRDVATVGDDSDGVDVKARDMIVITFAPFVYMLPWYEGAFKSWVGDAWFNKESTRYSNKIALRLSSAYLVSNHTGYPLTPTERARFADRGVVYTHSEYPTCGGYWIDTFVVNVDASMDVELTAIHPLIENTAIREEDRFRKVHFHLRLINLVGVNNLGKNENVQVVYSIGVPFAAFRPPTAAHVFTRVLKIGIQFEQKHDVQIQQFASHAQQALDAMHGDYANIMTVAGPGITNQPTVQMSDLLSKEEGLHRKQPMTGGSIPLPWEKDFAQHSGGLGSPAKLKSAYDPTKHEHGRERERVATRSGGK